METTIAEPLKDNISETPHVLEYKTIGPPSSRLNLIGVRYDLKSGKYMSYTTLKSTGIIHRIGLYPSEKLAAIAHDMQSLKMYGLLAHDYLNFDYMYEEDESNCEDSSSEKGSKAFIYNIRVKHPSGVMITIECDTRSQQESIDSSHATLHENAANTTAVVAETEIESKAEAVDNLICSPQGIAFILPGKADVNRRWSERLACSYYPTAAFAYEVTFTFQSSLGLQLRPFLLTYSVAGGKRTLGCCVVIDSSQSPTPLVQAGDILVSINGISLIGIISLPQTDAELKEGQKESSGEFNFDASVKAISQAVAPRTIRFLRTAGLSVNQQLSPAEASLLSVDHQPIAKYTVDQGGGGSIVYLDSQAPLSIKRMLQGHRIAWESAPASLSSQTTTVNPPFLCSSIPIEIGSSVGDEVSGGIYRDRSRFMAVLYMAPEGGHNRHHLLGRFDSEEEANAAYKWALEEVRLTGVYSGRRKKRLSITLGGSNSSNSIDKSALGSSTFPPPFSFPLNSFNKSMFVTANDGNRPM